MVTVHHEVINDGLELQINMRSSKRNKDTSSLTHMKGAVHALTFAIRNLGNNMEIVCVFIVNLSKNQSPKFRLDKPQKR